MENLKNLVKSLLKKKPTEITIEAVFSACGCCYKDGNLFYRVDLYRNNEEYKLNLSINDTSIWIYRELDLSEKEYMEIKWTIESWNKRIEEEFLDAFKNFAEDECDSMDELLND